MIKIKHKTTEKEIEVEVSHYENILKHQDWEICNELRREDAQLFTVKSEGKCPTDAETTSEDRPEEGKPSNEQGQSVRKTSRVGKKTSAKKRKN